MESMAYLLLDWYGFKQTRNLFLSYWIQTSQTGGKPFSETSPYKVSEYYLAPWFVHYYGPSFIDLLQLLLWCNYYRIGKKTIFCAKKLNFNQNSVRSTFNGKIFESDLIDRFFGSWFFFGWEKSTMCQGIEDNTWMPYKHTHLWPLDDP